MPRYNFQLNKIPEHFGYSNFKSYNYLRHIIKLKFKIQNSKCFTYFLDNNNNNIYYSFYCKSPLETKYLQELITKYNLKIIFKN